MTPTREPVGERIARVETKVDGVVSTLDKLVTRVDALATQNDVARLQAEVDDVKSSRRWAVATFLPILISLVALAYALTHGAAA